MEKYKKILKISIIITLIACSFELILQSYYLISSIITFASSTNTEPILVQLFYRVITQHIIAIALIVLSFIFSIKTNKNLKLDRNKFLLNQNLYIWFAIILGALVLTGTIYIKLLFLTSFILFIIGLCDANKKINITADKKEEYNEKLKNINLVYEQKLITEQQKKKLEKDLYNEYYSN